MLRFAIIGAGRIGAVHAASIAAHPGAELCLICDPDETTAARLADSYGARTTGDVSDVYASEADAVIIGSPTRLHVDQIIASVDAGKAVLCEKPIDLDVDRVDRCIAALDGQEHRVMTGFNRRFDPTFAEIHTRVWAGEIGELEQLTITSRDPQPPPPGYLAASGGIFRDMTIHDFDMVRFFLGDVAQAHAVGQATDPAFTRAGDFDGAVTSLVSSTGAVATIINSRHCATGYDQRLEAFGAKGTLEAVNRIATTVRSSTSATSAASGPYLHHFLERYADAYRLELSHFIDAISTGKAPTPTIHDGREALVLAEHAACSAQATSHPTPILR